MKDFIIVHRNREPQYIAVRRIQAIHPCHGNYDKVSAMIDADTADETYYVDESPDEIMALIEGGRGVWTHRRVQDDKTDPYGFFRDRFYCSRCGDYQTYGATPFCCNCGAPMEPDVVEASDGEKEN